MSKEKQPEANYNNVFDAEYAEAIKQAKVNLKRFNELLKEEPSPETVTVPSMQKIRDAKLILLSNHLSAKIQTLLEFLHNKIWSLAEERDIRATYKAGSLSEIRTQLLNLQSNIKHTYPRKDILQAIAAIQQTIIDSQDELSNYRSKWGSAFFFGTLLRRDLTKRVTSKILIDDLSDELDDIKRSIDSPKIM